MHFAPTTEQRELAERLHAFARAEKTPAHGLPFDRTRWRRWGEFGVLGLCAPEAHGGTGASTLATALAVEALGRGSADMGFIFSAMAHLFACVMPIAEHGNAALQSRLLPKLVSGEWVGANAISEAEAGSDVLALKTRAVRDGDGFRLTGTKSYVTNAPVADVFLVYAVTNPDDGYLGLSAFAIEKGTPGLSVGSPFQKAGLKGSPIAQVYLEDCRVGPESLVGAEGQGALVFKKSMLWERSCLFGAYVGLMDRLIATSVEHVKRRKQFGKPLSANQAIAHRLAQMKVRLEGARLLLYRACAALDAKQEATALVAMAKLAVSEAAVQCGVDAVQLFGGLGIIEEVGIVTALNDALPSRIFSGSSEMQLELVAKGLGL